MDRIRTRSVAYTTSINPRIVHAIPTAGPLTTPIIGFGKSINEPTNILKTNVKRSCTKFQPEEEKMVKIKRHLKQRFPSSAASRMVPVKDVKDVKSFPLEKILPAPVTATRVVFGSSAASFKSYEIQGFYFEIITTTNLSFVFTLAKPTYIPNVKAFFVVGLLSVMILSFPSIVTSNPGDDDSTTFKDSVEFAGPTRLSTNSIYLFLASSCNICTMGQKLVTSRYVGVKNKNNKSDLRH